jgi:hypothetical protein
MVAVVPAKEMVLDAGEGASGAWAGRWSPAFPSAASANETANCGLGVG